jgi:glycosyltransferase involved in cell wall biosynthesis
MTPGPIPQAARTADPMPLVSIIVPTFNRGRFLDRCLRSILEQSYSPLECIVVDGASTDNTLDILKHRSATDPRLRFISEPDDGEVYASNKGLDLARGEISAILASDDCYEPGAVETSVDFLRRHPQFIGVSGDALYVDEDGRSLNRGVITYRGRMDRTTIRRLLILRYVMCPVYHAAFFGWRERLLKHGKLDPAFSVIPDFEFYLRLLAAGEQIGCLPRVQVRYTLHTDMGAIKHRTRVERQRALLHQRLGLKWYHNVLRLTLGRVMSYLANPYRSPFLQGSRREVRDWQARRRATRCLGSSPH